MDIALEFVILCSSQCFKIDVSARQKTSVYVRAVGWTQHWALLPRWNLTRLNTKVKSDGTGHGWLSCRCGGQPLAYRRVRTLRGPCQSLWPRATWCPVPAGTTITQWAGLVTSPATVRLFIQNKLRRITVRTDPINKIIGQRFAVACITGITVLLVTNMTS